MEFLQLKDALEFMREIVNDSFAKKGIPITGAALKVRLIRKAEAAGKTFQERALGFRNFVEFVLSDKDLAVERREVGDFSVKPIEAGPVELPASRSELTASKLIKSASSSPRIREDLWFAFMSFPKPGFRREYNRETDKVLYPPDSAPRAGIVIESIAREQQIDWRKEFSGTIDAGVRESLLQALSAPNPFREFSIALKLQPDLLKKWNSFLFSKIHPVISSWAEQNKIPTEVWQLARTDGQDSQRRALYRLLDQVPIEELLEITVPLRWFFQGKK
jgi:hypothetical protein